MSKNEDKVLRGIMDRYKNKEVIETDFSKASIFNGGSLPEKWTGVDSHGNSIFYGVAHRAAQAKHIDNLIHNQVDDMMFHVMQDAKGANITTPYVFNGKMCYPNKDGRVPILNAANVKMALELKAYQNAKINKLIKICFCSDAICAYLFAMPEEQWQALAGETTAEHALTHGIKMHAEMAKENCTIEYLEGLVAGSLLQTRGISKLRKIVGAFEKYVQLEDLDSLAERNADMMKGDNVVKLSEAYDDALKNGRLAIDQGIEKIANEGTPAAAAESK